MTKQPGKPQEQLDSQSPSKSASAEQLFQALTNLLSQQKSQSHMSVKHQEPRTPTGLTNHCQHNEISKPRQLPQDNERLNISHKQESREREAREWGAMIKNINVIMFAIYRCNKCLDYYSTMKSTMSQHMKIIHHWTYSEEEDTGTPVEDNVTITENIQNKVSDIQNVFERRFRNESIANDNLDLELGRQNELVEIPFSSVNACKIPVDETTVVKEHSNEEGGDSDEYGSIYGQSDDDLEKEEPESVGKTVHQETISIRKNSHSMNCKTTQENSHRMSKIESNEGDLQADKDRARKETIQVDGASEHVQQAVRNTSSASVEAKEMKSYSSGQKGSKDSSTEHQMDEGDGNKSEERNLSQEKPKQVWPPQKEKIETIKIRDKTVRRGRRTNGRFVSLADLCNGEVVNDSSKNVECSVGTSSDDQHDGGHTNLTDTQIEDNRGDDKGEENQSNETCRKSAVNVPPKTRTTRTTRSVTRSQVDVNNIIPDDTHNKDGTTPKRKWISLTKDEVWKKMGFDPKTRYQPPYLCIQPGCDKKTPNIGGLLLHHRMKHDTFGDREQFQLAQLLGERYSLYKGREKRAVERVSSDDDEEDAGDGKGTVKSRRKKKPPKRLSDETIGNNTNFLLKSVSAKVKERMELEKPLQCQYCRCRYKYQHGLNHHIRTRHRKIWIAKKNLTEADFEEISNISCKKKVSSKEIPEDDDSEQRDENCSSEPLMECQECGFYSTEYGFVSHMKIMHNQDIVLRYQCDTCELIFATKQELQRHKRNNHMERIVCEACGKSVRGEKQLAVHKKFWCGKKKSRKKASVQPHNTIKISKTCKICNKVCPSYIAYSYHVAGHGIENPFSCHLCQKKFKWKSQLMQHNYNCHTECRYQCKHCSYKSHYKGQMKHHLLKKHDIGGEDFPDLKCPFEECDFTTKLRYKLNIHKEKHDIRRFKHWCHGCNQPVLNLKTWAKHQVLHRDGVTKYKCDICGHQATDSNGAHMHKRSKHMNILVGRVTCDLCGTSFASHKSLKNHRMLLHEKINPIKCRGCEQTFKNQKQMRKHFRTAHVDLARAEEAVQRQEVEDILSGVKKKKVPKKLPTGRPRGRPKVPLTPEVIARRKEQTRIRNQKKNANYMAKLKSLGLKRKKYPKKKKEKTSTGAGASNQKRKKTVTKVSLDPNQEAGSAEQQLENIAQASTSDLQLQEQMDLYYHQARPTSGIFPIKITPAQNAYEQLTDLHDDTGLQTYAYEQTVTTSANTNESTQYPGFTSQEEVGMAAETFVVRG